MRTIKFRGKSIGTGEWLFGNLFQFGIQPPTNVPCICPSVPTWEDAVDIYNVDEKTVGQFTGMYDKNGNEIYEGDIVRVLVSRLNATKNKRYMNFPVSYNSPFGCFETANGCPIPLSYKYCIEVIGNIHDNPELLNDEKD